VEDVRKKILIIDDDERHLIAAKEILEEEGYNVVVQNGFYGITNLVAKLRPDLLLLDVNMPGLSGEMLSPLLLANNRTKDVPIVFYSSNDEDSLRNSVQKYGVAGYICKGDILDLRKKVAKHISS
jgi:CheY-like chemotaxis protein